MMKTRQIVKLITAKQSSSLHDNFSWWLFDRFWFLAQKWVMLSLWCFWFPFLFPWLKKRRRGEVEGVGVRGCWRDSITCHEAIWPQRTSSPSVLGLALAPLLKLGAQPDQTLLSASDVLRFLHWSFSVDSATLRLTVEITTSVSVSQLWTFSLCAEFMQSSTLWVSMIQLAFTKLQ